MKALAVLRVERTASGRVASARMAPVYAASVSASAAATEAIISLKVPVSVSSSRLDPVNGSRASTLCEAAIDASEPESSPIGLLSIRANVSRQRCTFSR